MSEFVEVPASYLSVCQRKLVFGVGINDAPYLTNPRINGKRATCPFYSRWVGILERCYSDSLHKSRPTYIGCYICEEWKRFMSFKEWMSTQNWKDMHLDKDLKYPGNKQYSPEKCIFIPLSLNSLLTGSSHKRAFPTGVDFHKQRMKYRARYSDKNNSVYLGHYDTIAQADQAYRKHKSGLIRSYVKQFPEIKDGLLIHADKILNGGSYD